MSGTKLYKNIVNIGGVLIVGLLLAIFITLFLNSYPSIREYKFNFFTSKIWDPVFEKFGALPFIIGTLLTSFISLVISIPFSLSVSLFVSEYYENAFFSRIFETLIDLLAGIPSVIYGLWGFFYVTPIVRNIQIKFLLPPTGVSILTASLVLSIMIIPYASSIAKEVIKLVPNDLKEAGYSLGASQYEVIRKVIFPYAKSGIFAGILLSLGRALGETMAVTMVIGNSIQLPKSIFQPGNTIASIIANEFTEAVGELHLSSLIELGLILFLITLIINLIANLIIKKYTFFEI